jgi:hypothetical protein
MASQKLRSPASWRDLWCSAYHMYASAPSTPPLLVYQSFCLAISNNTMDFCESIKIAARNKRHLFSHFSKPVDFVYILPCAGLRVKFIAQKGALPVKLSRS